MALSPKTLWGFPQLKAAALATFAAFNQWPVDRGVSCDGVPSPSVGTSLTGQLSPGCRALARLFAAPASPLTSPLPGLLPFPCQGSLLGPCPRNPSAHKPLHQRWSPRTQPKTVSTRRVRGSKFRSKTRGLPGGTPHQQQVVQRQPLSTDHLLIQPSRAQQAGVGVGQLLPSSF